MTIQVVGAGVGRTGTHTLKIALERLLGGTCHHMLEVFGHPEEVPVWHRAFEGEMPDWETFLGGYSAIVDWPGGGLWREISAAFPDAPVVLSTRSAESWYRSAQDTIFNAFDPATAPGDNEWLAMAWAMLRYRFCDEITNPEAMMAAFERHNAEVRATVPKDRLIEWTATDGWEPLCAALGVPVPDEPFPVTNTTEEFRERMGLDPV